jgi:vacuolar-type H+-ATPase subunit F/Vma7
MTQRRLVVIATSDLSAGFALTGVPVFEAIDGEDAARHLEQSVDDMNAGVVIIDESLYRDLPDELQRTLRRSTLPVVIPVPGPDWTTESTAHDYIVDILRRAIGYRVRLQ